MEISKSKFDKIYAKYKFWIYSPEMAFDFVHDVLAADADHLEQHEPEATATIRRLNDAAYEVYSMGSDVSGEAFGGEIK